MPSSPVRATTLRRVVLTILVIVGFVIIDLGLPLARLYVGSALFSACLMYLFRKPHPLDLVAIACLGPAATALHCWLWFRTWFDARFFLILSGFGIATFAVLTLRAIWSDESEKKKAQDILIPAGALTAVLFASNWLNTGRFWPRTLDLYLYSFDGSLRFMPSFWMGRFFREHAFFSAVSVDVYSSVLLVMVLAHIAHQKIRPAHISKMFMFNAFLVAAVVGFGIYQLYPACGPVYAFPAQFPMSGIPVHDIARLVLEPLPLNPIFPRNAMPSLHMTWALLAWWNMRGCGRWLFVGGFFFVLFTGFGTLGTGEHYLIDLVVAFPLTVFVQAVSCWHLPLRLPSRMRGIVVGLALTLAWIGILRVGIRFFWISPIIPWACIAATIGVSVWLLIPLTRFTTSEESALDPSTSELSSAAVPS